MADSIVVSVEIADAEYIKEFEVDPSEPLVKLLHRVAKDEQIPLRKKSGHPLVWTAEGPDIREGHAGEWTELTRTQPLTRISNVVIERYGPRSPMFTVRFSIPGAGEALNERRESEKRDEIEARMAQRAAERKAEKSASIGDAEDEFVIDYSPPPGEAAASGTKNGNDDGGFENAVGIGGVAAAGAGLAVGAGLAGSARGGAGRGGSASSVEGRIKRRSAGHDASEKPRQKKKKKKSGTSGSRKQKAKTAPSGPFAGTPLENVPVWAMGAAVGTFALVLGLVVFLFSGGEEPPAPEPTPAPVDVGDIEIATPPPPPPPPPEAVEEATPPPMEQFYSRGKFVSYQAKEVSAQLTSFTKTNVSISYNVTHPSAGLSHTIGLQGRFKIKISDGGGNMNGKAFTAGVTPGKPTRVNLRYDGKRLTLRVGGKRAGSWGIPDSGGFPRWQLNLDPTTEITGLRASAQAED